MKKIKVMSIFGTRPEAIKMCPLVKELETRSEVESLVCVTAQHRDMLDSVLNLFQVIPDYDLNIMKQNQDLFDITTNVLSSIKSVLEDAQPDLVLVHGDTTTTFAASLAAFYLKIPVGHVEAGLRTYNIHSPYPEEFNRQAVSRLATIHFAPTENAKRNLVKEGVEDKSIYVTGNTAIDSLKTTVSSTYEHEIINWAGSDKLILLTAHRRENIGEPMEKIFKAVRKIVENNEDVKVVYPIHKNPLVRNTAKKTLSDQKNIKIIEPLDVIDFHNIMERSYLILTDSGGIQEEAPSLGKPVLVLRDTTERPEGVDAGTLILAGTEEEDIYDSAQKLLTDVNLYRKMSSLKNPYGDGNSSVHISDIIVQTFFEKPST